MANPKDKIKSLVFSNDRNFRTQTIRLLNDVAFASEKLMAVSNEEAIRLIQSDTKIENMVINAEEFDPKIISQLLDSTQKFISERNIKVLVYIKEDQADQLKDLQTRYTKFFIRKLPLKKADFLEAYHHSRPSLNSRTKIHHPDKPTEPEHLNRGEAELKTFSEALEHLKVCLVDLNEVLKDPKTHFDKFLGIGQKFNGLVGTFALVKHKDDYKNIYELAIVIDDVTRTYEAESSHDIKKAHLQLMALAVKCAFLILKSLKDNIAPEEKVRKEAAQIFAAYLKMGDILHRSEKKQEDVDALLEELSASA